MRELTFRYSPRSRGSRSPSSSTYLPLPLPLRPYRHTSVRGARAPKARTIGCRCRVAHARDLLPSRAIRQCERLRFHVYRFLIALSVRPTKCFEISDHLVPSSETHATISASSSTVQPPFRSPPSCSRSSTARGMEQSRHCFPVRPLTSSAISDQCPSPDLATATRLGAAHPSRPSTCTTGWRPRGFSCVMLEMRRLPPLLLLVLLLPPPPPLLLLLLLHVRPPRAAHRPAAARAPRAHARRRPGGGGRP